MEKVDLISEPWSDYELIDSGGGEKLERYGDITLIRPETQALWSPARPAEWKKAAVHFHFKGGRGIWTKKETTPEEWEIRWKNIRFSVRLTSFKHTGVFPEQVPNWEWIAERVKRLGQPKVLNLFGYTGLASLVAVHAGARVTHIDASKQSNAWAKNNARLSTVAPGGIRFLLDDALKFAEREGRRGSIYDGIILDPPAFGRGPKGEVWKIEDGFVPLLKALVPIFSPKPGAFFLLNGYAAGYAPLSFLQATASVFPEIAKAKGEFGELNIKESDSGRLVPSGIYLRFVR